MRAWRREFGDPLRGVVDALAEAATDAYCWTVNAGWWARLKLRPVQHVIWGGRPELDVWIGSPQDRRRQQWLRSMAGYRRAGVRLTLAFRDALTPAVRDAQRALAQLGESMARQQRSGVPASEAMRRLSRG